MKFTTHKMIQFSHCDPAGIVFYPQFFYILSESKEDFLIDIGHPQHHYINKLRKGWPMVRLETDFKRPSRYGDQIDVDIEVFKLGNSSLGLEYTIRGDDGEERWGFLRRAPQDAPRQCDSHESNFRCQRKSTRSPAPRA